jgi:hypothetical protein
VNCNCNSSLQNDKTNFNEIAAKMAKKIRKTEKSEILLSSRGITLAKMNQSNRNANWNSNS